MSWQMACAYYLGISIDEAYEIDPGDLTEEDLEGIDEFMDRYEVVELNGVPHFFEVDNE